MTSGGRPLQRWRHNMSLKDLLLLLVVIVVIKPQHQLVKVRLITTRRQLTDNCNTQHTYSHHLTDWLIEQCLTSPPTQYRLSGRKFYRSKDPTNSIKVLKEKNSTKVKKTQKKQTTQNTAKHSNTRTANPLVYNNTGWLGDGSHRGHGRQAWTAVGLPPRYPQSTSHHNEHLVWARVCYNTI